MSSNSKDLKVDLQPAASRAQVRVLVADDQRWLVREIAAPQLDRRGGMHLLFESDGVMRRLRDYPADWFELDDAELYALTDRFRRND